MKSLCTAAGAALLACSLAGFAQTETACDQALDVRLRSRAVLAIDSLQVDSGEAETPEPATLALLIGRVLTVVMTSRRRFARSCKPCSSG